jgi:hypothetical protein
MHAVIGILISLVIAAIFPGLLLKVVFVPGDYMVACSGERYNRILWMRR